MTPAARQARRDRLRALLMTGAPATQEALRDALLRDGIEVTQATVSRDLRDLRARRVHRPGGSPGYELPLDEPADSPALGNDGVAGLVEWIARNEGLVVVHTAAGAASAVARAIDLRRVPGVLASLAGDDTVFVAPARQRHVKEVEGRLRALFGRGAPGDRGRGL